MQKLKDLMSRDVQIISPDGTIKEAAQQMRKGRPPIHNDKEGNFITCPHCSKRIAMAPVTGDLSGGVFEIARDQICIVP